MEGKEGWRVGVKWKKSKVMIVKKKRGGGSVILGKIRIGYFMMFMDWIIKCVV